MENNRDNALSYFVTRQALEALWSKQPAARLRRFGRGIVSAITCIVFIIACIVLFIPALLLLPFVYFWKKRKSRKEDALQAKNQAAATTATDEVEDIQYSWSNENAAHCSKQSHSDNKKWLLSLSKEFLKSIAKIDRKLQGRILSATSEIVDAPVAATGKTLKEVKRDG